MKTLHLEKQISTLKRERNAAMRRAKAAELAAQKDRERFKELHDLRTADFESRDALEMELLSLKEQIKHYTTPKPRASVVDWFRTKVIRAQNWLKVKRLSKARVDAITEYGNVPNHLISLAQRYWEQDLRRLRYEAPREFDRDGKPAKWNNSGPDLVQRIKIILGRA
jgi:hypothetical protein